MMPALSQVTAVCLLLWISLGWWEEVDFLSLSLWEISFSSTQWQGLGSQFCLGSGWLRIVCQFFNGRHLSFLSMSSIPSTPAQRWPLQFSCCNHNFFLLEPLEILANWLENREKQKSCFLLGISENLNCFIVSNTWPIKMHSNLICNFFNMSLWMIPLPELVCGQKSSYILSSLRGDCYHLKFKIPNYLVTSAFLRKPKIVMIFLDYLTFPWY